VEEWKGEIDNLGLEYSALTSDSCSLPCSPTMRISTLPTKGDCRRSLVKTSEASFTLDEAGTTKSPQTCESGWSVGDFTQQFKAFR
jgi:hypothetical protein